MMSFEKAQVGFQHRMGGGGARCCVDVGWAPPYPEVQWGRRRGRPLLAQAHLSPIPPTVVRSSHPPSGTGCLFASTLLPIFLLEFKFLFPSLL